MASKVGKKGRKRATTRCRRCGKATYNKSKAACSSCGYGKSPKIRRYNWNKKHGNKGK